jgi:DNA replication protein DnaC
VYAELLGQLGKRYHPPAVSVKTYTCPHPQNGQREVLKSCQALVDRLDVVVQAGECLVWYGSPGTGKDHLMASLLHVAAGRYGFDCRWVRGSDLFILFRDAMARRSSEGKLVREFSKPTVLAISDPIPQTSGLGAYQAGMLANIIDARYADLRPTWVTMNANGEEHARGLLGKPTWSRLIDSGHVFRCYWPDYREERRNGAPTSGP